MAQRSTRQDEKREDRLQNYLDMRVLDPLVLRFLLVQSPPALASLSTLRKHEQPHVIVVLEASAEECVLAGFWLMHQHLAARTVVLTRIQNWHSQPLLYGVAASSTKQAGIAFEVVAQAPEDTMPDPKKRLSRPCKLDRWLKIEGTEVYLTDHRPVTHSAKLTRVIDTASCKLICRDKLPVYASKPASKRARLLFRFTESLRHISAEALAQLQSVCAKKVQEAKQLQSLVDLKLVQLIEGAAVVTLRGLYLLYSISKSESHCSPSSESSFAPSPSGSTSSSSSPSSTTA